MVELGFSTRLSTEGVTAEEKGQTSSLLVEGGQPRSGESPLTEFGIVVDEIRSLY